MISGNFAYNTWGFLVSNQSTPSVTPGTAVTSGASNVKGAWTQLLAGTAVTTDCYEVSIYFGDNNASAVARPQLVDIGIDPAGGTTYTTLIPNLMCGNAGGSAGGGIHYRFPLFIPAGASIAARSINLVASAVSRVFVRLSGKPSRPDILQFGTYVFSIGTVTNSLGVSLTPGTSGAEGAWVSLGTTAEPAWFWNLGLQYNDATMSAVATKVDLAVGNATNKTIIIQNLTFSGTAAESFSLREVPQFGGIRPVGPSETLYARASCSGTPDSGANTLAYGMG